MEKLVKSDANLESVMQPLVAAFKVPKLSDACRVLFVNGDALTLSAELEQMGIVALQGVQGGNIEGADLVISESQIQLIKVIQGVLPQFLEKFMEPIVSASVSIASIQDEKEKQSILAAMIVGKVKGEEETKQFGKIFMAYLGSAISSLMSGS